MNKEQQDNLFEFVRAEEPCPNCKHPIKYHLAYGCYVLIDNNPMKSCDCKLDGYDYLDDTNLNAVFE